MQDDSKSFETKAYVKIKPDKNSKVMGFLSLTENSPGNIHLEGTVIGLSPGLHGFHIHESSNRTEGCTSFGPHYNPRNKDHGRPEGE